MQLRQVYFINLAKDTARRARMETRLDQCLPQLPHHRMDAIGADRLAEFEPFFGTRLPARLQATADGYPRPGTIGCFISHYLCIKAIADSWDPNDPHAAYLVLEDDCVFDASVMPKIEAMAHQLPTDWRAIKHSLGRSTQSDRISRNLHDISRARTRDWDYYWGTHFVIYRGSTAAEIVEALEQTELTDFDGWLRNHVDGVYSVATTLNIKQSNLGGSNTNPDYADPKYEDPFNSFSPADRLRGLVRKVHSKVRRLRQIVTGK